MTQNYTPTPAPFQVSDCVRVIGKYASDWANEPSPHVSGVNIDRFGKFTFTLRDQCGSDTDGYYAESLELVKRYAHDDLVVTLKEARKMCFSPEGKLYEGCGKVVKMIDDALAKAEAVQS